MIYDALLNTCQQLAKKAAEGMKRILSKTLYKPINKAGIYSKTDLDVNGDGKVITIKTHLPNYAYWVEHGRRPGRAPNPANLKDWCLRHMKHPSEAGAKSFSYALAKKIAKRGTEGKHFLTPIDRMLEMLRRVVPTTATKEIQHTIYTHAKTLEEIEINI